MKNIYNFSIIAHIDHGKLTLSDRITQICGGLSDREMEAQVPDSMDFERERDITTKAQSVTLDYKVFDGETYQLNFIDTPGHVDFSYEVSRSLAACEGALLVVDVGRGAEAQTLANCYTVMEMDLEVVPVLNKIDLPAADPERVAEEVEGIVGIDAIDAVHCSAKTGVGVQGVPERLVRNTPPPEDDLEGPLQALIIDSWFDNYLSVVSLIRIKDGTLRKGDKVKVMSIGQTYNADRLGILTPKQVDRTELKRDEVDRPVCTTKDIHGAPVGDILTLARNPAEETPLGSKKVKPQVYAGLLPVSSDDYEALRDALGKLSLNDASLFYEPKSSSALGFGLRRGFLGPLHMETIQERLEREYDLDPITTAPTVVYEAETTSRGVIYIDSLPKLPAVNNIYKLYEPIAECHMLLPQAYLGNVITLCIEKRGVQVNMVYHGNQVALTYEVPMVGVVLDFFDRLKFISRGYAPLNHNFKRFQAFDTVCIDVLINGEHVDALVLITHRGNSQSRGYELVEKTKDLISCQQFGIATQATTGTHTIMRSIMKQPRKNVLVKCYGGDISRKKKLLQKQEEGKRRTKQVGNVELPQEAFFATLHVGKDNKQPLGVGMVNMFALILAIATLVTGILWCADKLFLAPERRERQATAQVAAGDSLDKATLKKVAPKLGWLETGVSVFPVLTIILIVRSLIYEPFQIPPGSMIPTLLIDDFILIEKFTYGIKDPIYQKTLIETGHPKRGDIVVFKYPEDPKLDYIKRVVDLPGDKVTYGPVSKELTVQPGCNSGQACENALPVTYSNMEPNDSVQTFSRRNGGETISGFFEAPENETKENGVRLSEREETLGDTTHRILTVSITQDQVGMYYQQPGQRLATWIVPPGQYFMMGDNRDGSMDSRYRDSVPEANLVGRATAIWMSFDKQEGEWSTGMCLSRIGGIR